MLITPLQLGERGCRIRVIRHDLLFIDILEVVEGHWQTPTLFYLGSCPGTKLFFEKVQF